MNQTSQFQQERIRELERIEKHAKRQRAKEAKGRFIKATENSEILVLNGEDPIQKINKHRENLENRKTKVSW